MNRKLVAFFKDLCHVDNVVVSRAAPREKKKRLIEIHLFVEVVSKKNMKVIFDEKWGGLTLFTGAV